MKGFIAAIMTLCLLTGAIIWNGMWVHRTLGELTDITDEIEKSSNNDRVPLSEELFNKWKKCRHILSITVSHTEIETIDSRIVSLVSYAENEEESDFDAALAQLSEDLEYLHRSESLTVEGII